MKQLRRKRMRFIGGSQVCVSVDQVLAFVVDGLLQWIA